MSKPPSIPSLMRPLVLVGLMGAGKTTVGRRVASRLRVDFYDMDREIEEEEQASVSEIFASEGEAYFRACEYQMIQRLLNLPPAVIATGGGAFMQAEIRQLVAEKAHSLWLDAPLAVLLERVSRRNTRPLLEQGDKQAILERLYHERAPLYATAQWRVESSGAEHEQVVRQILQKLREAARC